MEEWFWGREPKDDILMSNVLQLTDKAKKFHPYLTTFFFSNMVFEFSKTIDFLNAVVGTANIQQIPQRYLTKIKKIAFSAHEECYNNW